MADTDKARPDILQRGWEDLKSYLQNADLSAGYVGAGLGAGIGALATPAKEGERAVDRAKRTLRNALTAGLLGGVGGQATFGGASTLHSGLTNTPVPHAGKGGEGGASSAEPQGSAASSNSLRALYAALGTQAHRLMPWSRGSQRKAFEKVFGDDGLGKVLLGSDTATLKPTSKLKPGEDPFSYRDDRATFRSGLSGESSAERTQNAKSTLSSLRKTPELRDPLSGATAPTLDRLSAHAAGLKNNNNIFQALGDKGVKGYLRSQGIRNKPTGFWDVLNRPTLAKGRALEASLFGTAAPSFMGRLRRRSVAGAGGAAGFFAPDIANRITDYFSSGEAAADPISGLPEFSGSTPPVEAVNPWLKPVKYF